MTTRTNILSVTIVAMIFCSSTYCRIISLPDDDQRSSLPNNENVYGNIRGNNPYYFVDPFYTYYIRYPKRSSSPEHSNLVVAHGFDKKGRPGSPLRFGKRSFTF